jgi:glycosyltransferase involved in cell wall biosynthesis
VEGKQPVRDRRSRPKRLALIIHALCEGGAQRVLSDMANHWARSGIHVTLVTLAPRETDILATDACVERVGLDLMRDSRGVLAALKNNLRRVVELRRALRQARPDYVISFIDQINVLTLVAALGLRLRVIVSDRVDPRRHPLGRAWSMLRRRFYRRCFATVVQTEAVREAIRPIVGRRPVYVIPNAVGADAVRGAPPRPIGTEGDRGRSRRLIAMGRLAPQKGFDILIDAFHSVAGRHPDWTLAIFGSGPSRNDLRQQIERLDLRERVRLHDWTDDPHLELSRADLFVLSSRYEGFPNVLLDAMACGLPVVSFDCPSGPADIVRHNVDGLLVEPENADALKVALDELMSNGPLRASFAARAVDVADRFSRDRFFARWDAVFREAGPDDEVFRQPSRAKGPAATFHVPGSF